MFLLVFDHNSVIEIVFAADPTIILTLWQQRNIMPALHTK
ncbi:hypothetical protein RAMDARK_1801 [Rickettsia amblyommatis str. Darkwater]|nr:hypothetical protein RAMDARK_1801 [Rickettsia amblyommatis str. Darkwater]